MSTDENLAIMEAQRGVPSSGCQESLLEDGLLELKKGRGRQGTQRGGGLGGGVCGAVGIMLDTEQGFIIAK